MNESTDIHAAPMRNPLFLTPPPVDENGRPRIQKVLIANRGEIACRIISTCRKLNIASVAVYVEEDASSRHILDADESINIGSIDRSSSNPFLDVELLVNTAVSVGAQAVHPGYGYLSENASFATRVREAGLIFIGPSPAAMSTLGDKRSSKDYLGKYAPDVPLIPGFSGSSQDVQDLEKAAAGIGFPVMLKASAGGGGKGMRIIHEASQLRQELERAQSEAQRSFGSSDCILEKYIESSKHVEIQIIGDSHGEVVSLLDRDCSVQRRHQKVIEETPCTFLTEETRTAMSATAVRIAKLIGYENAGTVEFVVDVKTNKFYFLEVNARLQVEHPITEEVTGVDLVSLQLFVAAGGSLRSLSVMRSLSQQGHAIECRLCAEDPQRDFFPEHGRVHLWLPAKGVLGPGRDVRYETAIQTGSSVSIYFDSMIAKIVVWAPTRTLAIEKMAKVLANTACVGVKTNQLFMQRCLLSKAFHNPAYTTSFIPSNTNDLLSPASIPNLRELSIIPCLFLRNLADRASGSSRKRPFQNIRKQFRNQRFDPVSVHCDVVDPIGWPYDRKAESKEHILCLWKRPSDSSPEIQEVSLIPIRADDNKDKDMEISPAKKVTAEYNAISEILRGGEKGFGPSYKLNINSWTPAEGIPAVQESWLASTMEVSINGSKILAHVVIHSNRAHALAGQLNQTQRIYCHFPSLGTHVEFERSSLLSYCESVRTEAKSQNDPEQKTITAPMPCKVLSVLKKQGDEVKSGETVMVIESMKMEVSITVGASGKFETNWKIGDAVEEGKVLCSVV
ncbi:hypothetical protein MW887_005566 [Aspergillus wentii]|nr:hypothetical protein MW887_005566 [Aspergillus wentii]